MLWRAEPEPEPVTRPLWINDKLPWVSDPPVLYRVQFTVPGSACQAL